MENSSSGDSDRQRAHRAQLVLQMSLYLAHPLGGVTHAQPLPRITALSGNMLQTLKCVSPRPTTEEKVGTLTDGIGDSPKATISQLAHSQADGSVGEMLATTLGLTLILDFQHPHGGK